MQKRSGIKVLGAAFALSVLIGPTQALARVSPSVLSAKRNLSPVADDNGLRQADALRQQGDAAYNSGRFDDAEKIYSQALKLRQTALGSDAKSGGILVRLLDDVYQAQSRYLEADAVYRKALTVFEGKSIREFTITTLNLTATYMQQCRLSEAADVASGAVNNIERSDRDWVTTSTFDLIKADPALGRAEALGRAMLAYLNDAATLENAYPAFWGPFEIVGESSVRIPRR